ncbi:MAG: ubiquinol-cytochrome c reductase iron-sulfur subunit [Planctomycetia bacterium]|nr:ubiquinol-cytochrome c reductase iron-sulfur subunit [Planctomycetia bacterium]
MPAKPDYAKKTSPAVKDEAIESRRTAVGFLGFAVGSFLAAGFSAMTATFGLWTLGFARFMFPNILTEPPNRFKVGFPADIPPGTVNEKFKTQSGVWLVNAEYNGKPQIIALSAICTHLGCTPNWLEAEQKFKCPCHGSGFYKEGINFEGPAPRPLERFAIRLADDGQLEVDKSRTFQEEKGEWSNPDCFVPV